MPLTDTVSFAAANAQCLRCGQTGLVQAQLLLTQQLFALAAGGASRGSAYRRSGHSDTLYWNRAHSFAALFPYNLFIVEPALGHARQFGLIRRFQAWSLI